MKSVQEGGLLYEWNLLHQDRGEVQVRSGDRITRVNNAETIEEMKAALRKAPSVNMTVCRYPMTFSMELVKQEGQKLGFAFEKPSNERLPELKITKVFPGALLDSYNQRQMEKGMFHRVVLPGMRIASANGVAHDNSEIAQVLKTSNSIDFIIKRMEVADMAKAKMQMRLNALMAFRTSTPPTPIKAGLAGPEKQHATEAASSSHARSTSSG